MSVPFLLLHGQCVCLLVGRSSQQQGPELEAQDWLEIYVTLHLSHPPESILKEKEKVPLHIR